METATLQEFGRKYTAAWCGQDAASVAAFFSARGSLKINEGGPSVGRPAITAAALGFMTAFPDMVVTMDGVSVEGNQAIYRWTLTGTNTGPGGTGKTVRISGYEEWTIGPDGLIAQSNGHFDEAEYNRQLKFGFDTPKEASVVAQTNNLYLPEELADASKTRQFATSDLAVLRTVADWIQTFVARPHKDLGRAGAVCPFVPEALERKTLWLASEHIADRSVPAVVELMSGYKRRFLDAQPRDGDGADYKVIVVVFTDLPADRAKGVFDGVLQHLAAPSYVENGILFGPFYEGNTGTAIYNSRFRPFQSPAPFLFVRQGVVSDWKFFLDNDDWLNRWAHRHGEAGARALAEELRRLTWRAGGDESHKK